MLLLAVDPGVTGAIAFRYGNEYTVEDIPNEKIQSGKRNRTHIKLGELADLLRGATDGGAVPAVALIEQVGPMPHDGKIQAFSLGRTLGDLEGMLVALGVQIRYVTPRKWKKDAGLSSDKEESRLRALQTFPKLSDRLSRKKDHNRAEALLLLDWLENNIDAV